jgi:hypothetical protein
MVTIDADAGAQDLDVLRHVRRLFDQRLGSAAGSSGPASAQLGDPITLMAGTVALECDPDPDDQPEQP